MKLKRKKGSKFPRWPTFSSDLRHKTKALLAFVSHQRGLARWLALQVQGRVRVCHTVVLGPSTVISFSKLTTSTLQRIFLSVSLLQLLILSTGVSDLSVATCYVSEFLPAFNSLTWYLWKALYFPSTCCWEGLLLFGQRQRKSHHTTVLSGTGSKAETSLWILSSACAQATVLLEAATEDPEGRLV